MNGRDVAALEFVRVARVGRVVHKAFGVVIVAAQHATAPPEPKRAGTILIDSRSPIPGAGRVSWIGAIVGKLLPHWIKTADTGVLPHPNLAASISIDRENVIGNQAVGIIGVVPVMFELPGAFIEPIKTCFPATQPKISACILVNAINVSAFAEGIVVFRAGKIVSHAPRF